MLALADRICVISTEKIACMRNQGYLSGIIVLPKNARDAHLHLFIAEATAMNKDTFYMAIFIMVVVEMANNDTKNNY